MSTAADISIIIDDDELIDDSVLAAFNNSDFNDCSTSKQQKTIENKSFNDATDLNVSALCCDEELDGYDKLTGQKWIYPVNYPVRDYQFNIIRAAILKNTLVSLPTGLGKTFIAAVLMYNFYRWYPMGKIVFTAPTRPLIAQQIEACYNIIAMPPDDTIEMTGSMNVTVRKEKWQTKRVFFATPQVVYNDIKSGICPGKRIRCLVIDEAHKAKSNYAYCQIVSTLTDMQHRMYRILALSATPGSRINDVIQVVKNLHIAHLELRTENCIDVAPYCHHRNIKTVVVPLGPELSKLRQLYVEILDCYARKLIQMNILKPNVGNLSKGRILMTYKEFQTNNRSHPQRSFIMKELSQLISLYHGLELLVNHGSRVFLNFFDEHPEKMWIQSDDRLTVMLERLRDDLGINPLILDTNVQPDGTMPEIPNTLSFGHPKFTKVREIMEEHFKMAKEKNEDTRAIVFCEYHETVKLVLCLLLQCRPLINARAFVGQGASGKGGRAAMSQQQQLRVMRQFRSGACNALVATCVAEEGLDVGSVDLIVCFDVATRSPVRLVQRCGRTGRERTGQVHFLVTEGREHQTLLDGMRQRDSLKSKILQSKEVQDSLYQLNPRLAPHGFTPACHKMFITVKKPLQRIAGKSRKNQKEKQSLPEPPTDGSTSPTNVQTSTKNVSPILPAQRQEINTKAMTSQVKEQSNTTESSRPKEIQILSSKNVDRITLGSQNQRSTSPLKSKQKKKNKIPAAKQNTDIRILFLAAQKPQQHRVNLFKELQGQDVEMSTQMLDLFIELKIESSKPKACYICNNICNCQKIQELRKKSGQHFRPVCKDEPIFPDINLIDKFDAESIRKYAEASTKIDTDQSEQEKQKNVCRLSECAEPSINFHAIEYTQEKTQNDLDLHNYSFFPSQCNNYDLHEIVDHSPIYTNSNASISCGKINKPFIESDIRETSAKDNHNALYSSSNFEKACVKDDRIKLNISHTFDIGDVEDIFADSDEDGPKTEIYQEKKEDFTIPSSNFDLGSFDDILEQNNNMNDEKIFDGQSLKATDENRNKSLCSNIATIDLSGDGSPEYTKDYVPQPPGSPSILSGTRKPVLISPILPSQARKLTLKRRVNNERSAKKKLNLKDSSMLSITQTIDLINSSDNDSDSLANQEEDHRRVSPILSTQSDRQRKIDNATINKSYNMEEKSLNIEAQATRSTSHESPSTSSLTLKRKIDDDAIASPYFDKKQKLNIQNQTTDNVQEKIFAILTSNDLNVERGLPNDKTVNLNYCTAIHKENRIYKEDKEVSKTKKNTLSLLDEFSYKPKSEEVTQRKEPRQKLNGKLPKRKKIKNYFIDLEAEVSDDGFDGSGDELSDGSAGSVADFVTDRDVTPTEEDMHAHYLNSVKSPVKLGAFKIPELPTKMKNTVYSQYVEEDSYEMDSFCVDSHIGLTQVDELSRLELAEMLLEEERRLKKKSRRQEYTEQNGDSPVIRRRNKNSKRPYVISDSEDSS